MLKTTGSVPHRPHHFTLPAYSLFLRSVAMCTCRPTQVKKEIIGLSECVTTSLRHHVGALKMYLPLSVKPLTDLNTTCITFMFTVHQRFCEGLWMCRRVHCYALLTWLNILPERCCTASSVDIGFTGRLFFQLWRTCGEDDHHCCFFKDKQRAAQCKAAHVVNTSM